MQNVIAGTGDRQDGVILVDPQLVHIDIWVFPSLLIQRVTRDPDSPIHIYAS